MLIVLPTLSILYRHITNGSDNLGPVVKAGNNGRSPVNYWQF